jgi:hypothetical protein
MLSAEPRAISRRHATTNPHLSHFRVRSADFQSAFSVIATVKPAASLRSGLLAFRADHGICGLREGKIEQAIELKNKADALLRSTAEKP